MKEEQDQLGCTQRELAGALNEIVSTYISGPGGDPDKSHLRAAAIAFVLLRKMELRIKGEKVYECCLRKDNIYDADFLKDQGLPE